jgi:hypothetical protein
MTPSLLKHRLGHEYAQVDQQAYCRQAPARLPHSSTTADSTTASSARHNDRAVNQPCCSTHPGGAAQKRQLRLDVTRALPDSGSALVRCEPPKGIEPLTYALRAFPTFIQPYLLPFAPQVSRLHDLRRTRLNGDELQRLLQRSVTWAASPGRYAGPSLAAMAQARSAPETVSRSVTMGHPVTALLRVSDS